MKHLAGRLAALFICAALCVAVPSHAALKVVWGDSWDGPGKSLQSIVDGLYGAGQIDVKTDFLGAKLGEPDPWFWLDNQFSALLVKEVAGNADYNQVGWYEETGAIPVLQNDGVHDGLVFDGPAIAGAAAVVSFSKPMMRFGFYLNPNGPGDATNAPERASRARIPGSCASRTWTRARIPGRSARRRPTTTTTTSSSR